MNYREALKVMGLMGEKELTEAKIKERYRSLIKKIHPDLISQNNTGHSLSDLEEYSKSLNIAYSVLKDNFNKAVNEAYRNNCTSSSDEKTEYFVTLENLLKLHDKLEEEVEDLKGRKIKLSTLVNDIVVVVIDIQTAVQGAFQVEKMGEKVRLYSRYREEEGLRKEYEMKFPIGWKERVEDEGGKNAGVLKAIVCDKEVEIGLDKLPARLEFSFRRGKIKIWLICSWDYTKQS